MNYERNASWRSSIEFVVGSRATARLHENGSGRFGGRCRAFEVGRRGDVRWHFETERARWGRCWNSRRREKLCAVAVRSGSGKRCHRCLRGFAQRAASRAAASSLADRAITRPRRATSTAPRARSAVRKHRAERQRKGHPKRETDPARDSTRDHCEESSRAALEMHPLCG